MLRIYRRLWETTWAEQWQYRASLMMYLLYWLVSPIIYLAVWTTIARQNGTVNGLTANDFVTYYLTLLIVDQLTSNIVIHVFPWRILDGSLSGELIKPIHPLLTSTFTYNIAYKGLAFIVLLPVWGLLVLLFRPDFSAVSLTSILAVLPMLWLGFSIQYLLASVVSLTAFWSQRAYSFTDLFFALVTILSGQFVPLSLMPLWIQRVGDFLPFRLFIYVPVQIILNRIPPADMLREYLLGLIWLGVSFVLFQVVWKQGLRRYSAVGA